MPRQQGPFETHPFNRQLEGEGSRVAEKCPVCLEPVHASLGEHRCPGRQRVELTETAFGIHGEAHVTLSPELKKKAMDDLIAKLKAKKDPK